MVGIARRQRQLRAAAWPPTQRRMVALSPLVATCRRYRLHARALAPRTHTRSSQGGSSHERPFAAAPRGQLRDTRTPHLDPPTPWRSFGGRFGAVSVRFAAPFLSGVKLELGSYRVSVQGFFGSIGLGGGRFSVFGCWIFRVAIVDVVSSRRSSGFSAMLCDRAPGGFTSPLVRGVKNTGF